ncbi:MAG: DNA polymerase III subunit delta [Bifidobacteriaceae bacterium]|nr:DNA polymerase III subunit delta [Bifidobacteriaceae bacterium]
MSVSPFIIVVGADQYLREITANKAETAAKKQLPEAQIRQADAQEITVSQFIELTSATLFNPQSIVNITNLQAAEEKTVEVMVKYCKKALSNPQEYSIVIAQHEGGVKGKKILTQLEKAGAYISHIPDLKKDDAKINYAIAIFEAHKQSIQLEAARQLVAVLGNSTGELTSMCNQLCNDFPQGQITVQQVNQYVTQNAHVTSFTVCDYALAGNMRQAIIALRFALEQGVDVTALIGAFASQIRQLITVQACLNHEISRSQVKMPQWLMDKQARRLQGWTSQGFSRCMQVLAWADEQSKSSQGDKQYALECCVQAMATKGRSVRHTQELFA